MTPEYEAMVARNKWHDREDFDAFVAAIKELSKEPDWTKEGNYAPGSNRWSWARNMRCKYVTLRIDMRDGGFVFCDSNGERISLDMLKYQYKSEE